MNFDTFIEKYGSQIDAMLSGFATKKDIGNAIKAYFEEIKQILDPMAWDIFKAGMEMAEISVKELTNYFYQRKLAEKAVDELIEIRSSGIDEYEEKDAQKWAKFDKLFAKLDAMDSYFAGDLSYLAWYDKEMRSCIDFLCDFIPREKLKMAAGC